MGAEVREDPLKKLVKMENSHMIILIIIIQYGTFQISFPDSWLIYNDYIR